MKKLSQISNARRVHEVAYERKIMTKCCKFSLYENFLIQYTDFFQRLKLKISSEKFGYF